MDIVQEIKKIRKEKNAVILAHNYQPAEIQDIADYTGDSLALSILAAKTEAERIVFCGVYFMAETAAILSPDKMVLLPELTAGCPMADMISAERLKEFRQKYPDAVVICYVNSPAEVKALSDYCCTSANAFDVVRAVEPEREIIFVPDKNLGQVAAETTGRDLILWPGYCPTHVMAMSESVEKIKNQHPDAVVLAHPECAKDIRHLADELLSTGGMLRYVAKSDKKEFIIATEQGIIHSLKKANPDKQFYCADEKFVCPNMKKISLEKVLFSLEEDKYKITVPSEIAAGAKKALDRMISIVPKG